MKLKKISWHEFVEEYWEKKPFVLNAEEFKFQVTEEELFECILNASKNGDNSGKYPFSIWIDNLYISDFQHYAPKQSDKNIKGYADRITGVPPTKEFTYYQGRLQVHSDKLWYRARVFSEGLLRLVGLPTKGINLDTFIGRYSSTPRGIHTDAASTFMAIVHGHKKMLLWPPEFFNNINVEIKGTELHKTLMDFDYKTVLDKAIVLDGDPGDILYWPSSYWHIGIADDPNELVAIINFGMFFDEQSNAMITKFVTDALQNSLENYHKEPTYKSTQIETALEVEFKALNNIREFINSSIPETQLKNQWLKRLSAVGFRHTPLPLDDDVEIDASTQFVIDLPVLIDKNENELFIYANGHYLQVDYDPTVIKILDFVNSGNTFSIESLNKLAGNHFGVLNDIGGLPGLVKYLFSKKAIRLLKALEEQ